MTTGARGLIFLSCMILASGPAAASELVVELSYEPGRLTMTDRDGFTDLRLPGSMPVDLPGAPAVPRLAEQIVLPEGMRAVAVHATATNSLRIPCRPPRPAQPPAILGLPDHAVPPPEWVAPDPAIYGGSSLYPRELAVLHATGHMAGANIAGCEVRPVQYDPRTGEIILHSRITLRLALAPDQQSRRIAPRPRAMQGLVRRLAAGDLHGLEHLPPAQPDGLGEPVDPTAYEYLIVTGDSQAAPYATYAAWKTAKGVPAEVFTVEWIAANYPGRDLPEQVRNFLIEAVAEWGSSYVLIGGDQEVVPARVCWAFDCEAGFYPDENDLYADLYYSDLDGTWDANGNGIFGEVADEIDLYPDILVGRAPSADLIEAAIIVDKFLTYEQAPPAGHAMEAFFFAEVLWQEPFTDSGIGKDMIAARHFAAYEPIERLYETLGNESPAAVLQQLNTGPHLTNHAGHANYRVMGCGDGYMDRADVSALHNAPHYFVLFSIGCWSAAFDYDCIGERFLDNANGGAIAFVGNSRYGWGSPGNPGWGYSETFDSDFYGSILSADLPEFGAALARPKIMRIPYAQDGNVYRWHEYQVNLLGDPEMTCHTGPIGELTLGAPAGLPLGATQFAASVEGAGGPMEGARLCLTGGDLYMVGTSDAGGRVVFPINIASPQSLTLTATADNHVYAASGITVAGDEPFLSMTAQAINEDAIPPSAGNGDGDLGPGETCELLITLHNFGGSTAANVSGTLSSGSPYVQLPVSSAAFGTLPGGSTASNGTPFVIEILSSCPPGSVISLTLDLSDDDQHHWSEAVPLEIVAPYAEILRHIATELSGDGDGIVEPGETARLAVRVLNSGGGNLSPLSAVLSAIDGHTSVTQAAAAIGGPLDPGQAAPLAPDFELVVAPGCPCPGYAALAVLFTHDEGTSCDTLLLAIGEPGFTDDMESGPGGWTHSGTPDDWHLTDYRQHSGTTSWYCGSAAHAYANNCDASLISQTLIAPDNAEFVFWCYYDVTIYGVDGLFIDIWQDADWETVDYLGSGGALDSLLFVCDWAEYSYALPAIAAGSATQIRFRFVSDAEETAEGFYIDDVCLRGAGAGNAAAEEHPLVLSAALSASRPNPARTEARWRLVLDAPGEVRARIVDPSGRLVRTLLSRPLVSGPHDIVWDGSGTGGTPAPAGLYFLDLRSGTQRLVRRVVRVAP